MINLEELTDDIFNYLKKIYGERMFGYTFTKSMCDNLGKKINLGIINGKIDETKFTIDCYERNVLINVDYASRSLLLELKEYLNEYLAPYEIRTSVCMIDSEKNIASCEFALYQYIGSMNDSKKYVK